MSKITQPEILASGSGNNGLTLFAAVAELPAGEAPEWITLFPQVGNVTTRDGRSYHVDAETLIAAFRSDRIKLPIDINHATDLAAVHGGAAEAQGWIVDLRQDGTSLQAKVDWLDSGRELLKARKYLYISPAFWQDRNNNATRLKAAALVTSPALADQPALAAATTQQEPTMKTLLTALGLSTEANEAACLAAVTDLKAKLEASVPKAVHETTVASLATATTELDALKKSTRDAKVEALLTAALNAKKILPAEKDHYLALCSSDEGLASVEKLIAAKPAMLGGSAIETRQVENTDGVTAAQLAAKASDMVAKGEAPSVADAVTMLSSKSTA